MMTLDAVADRYWHKVNELAPTVATVRGIHDHDTEMPRFDDSWVGAMHTDFVGLRRDAEASTNRL